MSRSSRARRRELQAVARTVALATAILQAARAEHTLKRAIISLRVVDRLIERLDADDVKASGEAPGLVRALHRLLDRVIEQGPPARHDPVDPARGGAR